MAKYLNRSKKPVTEPKSVKNVIRLPESVLVGPFRFNVRLWPEAEAESAQAAGLCDKHRNLILIKEKMNAQTVAEVLLHETMHAVFYSSGLDHVKNLSEEEEAIVCQIAMGLLTVMRHNPDFMPLIAQLLDADEQA